MKENPEEIFKGANSATAQNNIPVTLTKAEKKNAVILINKQE